MPPVAPVAMSTFIKPKLKVMCGMVLSVSVKCVFVCSPVCVCVYQSEFAVCLPGGKRIYGGGGGWSGME